MGKSMKKRKKAENEKRPIVERDGCCPSVVVSSAAPQKTIGWGLPQVSGIFGKANSYFGPSQ